MNIPPLLAQAEVTGSLAAEYAKMGVLGATVVALASALIALWRDNLKLRSTIEAILAKRVEEAATLQAQRVADSQAVTERMVAVTTQCVTVLTNVASNLEAQREALSETQKAIRDMADEMKRGRR